MKADKSCCLVIEKQTNNVTKSNSKSNLGSMDVVGTFISALPIFQGCNTGQHSLMVNSAAPARLLPVNPRALLSYL